jgi:hypothetical protein
MSDTYEAGPAPAVPRDTDGDGVPDYRDTDSDGDGILDGNDDQDHDGYPNIVEASRMRITETGLNDRQHTTQADVFPQAATRWWGRVNPFNPCLPWKYSATCPTFIPGSGVWAPFEDNDVDYMVFN